MSKQTVAASQENSEVEERLAALAAKGLLTLPKRKEPFREVTRLKVINGEPVSETLIRERR